MRIDDYSNFPSFRRKVINVQIPWAIYFPNKECIRIYGHNEKRFIDIPVYLEDVKFWINYLLEKDWVTPEILDDFIECWTDNAKFKCP